MARSKHGRVVLYRRVSALMGRGGEDFHSPDMQTAAMRKHIAAAGLREVAQHEDIDVSGRSFNREGLDQVRAMVEAGEVDAVAVYDLSRLGRNTGEALRFIRWLRDHHVSLISTVEKIDDSPEGQFMLTQFLALAELYSNQVGRRWATVIEHRARKGAQPGSVPATGYRHEDGRLVPDPELGPVVTDLARRYAAGEPVATLGRILATALGKAVATDRVKKIVCNPVYTGQVVIWGRRNPRMWVDTPVFVGEGLHEALIDQATHEACRTRARADATTPSRTLGVAHSLAGIARCGDCGGPLTLLCPSKGHTDRWTRLRCKRRGMQAGNDCGGAGGARLDAVEEAVLDDVSTYLSELRGNIGAALARQSTTAPDVAKLKKQRQDVEDQMSLLVHEWSQKLIPEAIYRRNLAELAEQEAALAARIPAAPPPPMRRAELVSLAEWLLDHWDELTAGERNTALRRMVEKVIVRRSDYWREPVEDRTRTMFRPVSVSS